MGPSKCLRCCQEAEWDSRLQQLGKHVAKQGELSNSPYAHPTLRHFGQAQFLQPERIFFIFFFLHVAHAPCWWQTLIRFKPKTTAHLESGRAAPGSNGPASSTEVTGPVVCVRWHPWKATTSWTHPLLLGTWLHKHFPLHPIKHL